MDGTAIRSPGAVLKISTQPTRTKLFVHARVSVRPCSALRADAAFAGNLRVRMHAILGTANRHAVHGDRIAKPRPVAHRYLSVSRFVAH